MKKYLTTLIVLLFAALACRPVLTIGWGEMLLFVFLLAILIGPPLYRLFRRLEDSHHHEREKEQEGKKSD
jgi:fatty acid desaturase